jgi:TatD DNase family protein
MFMPDHNDRDIERLAGWIGREHPVAIGECGLDFFIPDPDREGQQRCFEAQLQLAQQFDLPVIIHARRAVEAVIDTLRRYPSLRGVLHSFSGSEQQARRLIDMGFLMSFGGPLTYPRAHRLQRLVAALPLDAIMLETDSPDQPDLDQRGQRNEPARLPVILTAMTGLRNESMEEIACATTRNARSLFGIELE